MVVGAWRQAQPHSGLWPALSLWERDLKRARRCSPTIVNDRIEFGITELSAQSCTIELGFSTDMFWKAATMAESPKQKTQYGIFLSSTDDPVVREYRLAARDLIQEPEFREKWFAVEMSTFVPGTPPPLQTCRNEVLSCSVYIGILGPIYGTVIDEVDLSYTEYEYTVAREAQDREIAIFLLPDSSINQEPPDLIFNQGRLFERQQQFRNAVASKTHTVAKITDLEQFKAQLAKYLRALSYPPRATTPQSKPATMPFSTSSPDIGFDRQSVLGYTLPDMDATLIEDVLLSAEAQRELARLGALRAPREQQIRALGLINDDNRLSVGAFFCFAPASLLASRFSAIGLHMVAYDGSNRALSRTLDLRESFDNLVRLFDEGVEFLRRNLNRVGIAGSSDRDDLEVPFRALREALANALVHRDYDQPSSREQPTRIEIYTDRVEITSYGSLVGGVSVEALNEDPEHVVPRRRNPIITTTFRLMTLIELNASGIARMQELLRQAQLRPAEITQQDGDPPSVTVTFYRPSRRSETPSASERIVALSEIPAPAQLIGRSKQLAQLKQRLIEDGDVGIIALGGMGGIGKTALAATAVHLLSTDAQAFPGGVMWLACAGLEGETGALALLAQVARYVGRDDIASLSDVAGLRHALSAVLRSRPRTLLTLDNIEPGLDIEAMLSILAVPGHTTLLLTSRSHIAPSLVYSFLLAPLATPDAISLFAHRLEQTTGGARPDAADRTAIPALVETVDGLPLAIELLAAYAGMQHMPLTVLLTELDRDSINSAALRPDPQRAIASSFARTMNVLSPSQRILFAALALLPGPSFQRAAAIALARAASDQSGYPGVEEPTRDLATLVNVALVETQPNERLRMHPLIQAYARDQLGHLPVETQSRLGDALLAYWLEFAETHVGYEGMSTLETEASGLMGALTWAHSHARWRSLLRLATAMDLAWSIRGRRADERLFRPWAVEAASELGDHYGRLNMTHGLATLDAQTGEPERARAGFEQALMLARELGDKAAIRAELHALATLDADASDFERARERFEEALTLARELSDQTAIEVELDALAAFGPEPSLHDTHEQPASAPSPQRRFWPMWQRRPSGSS